LSTIEARDLSGMAETGIEKEVIAVALHEMATSAHSEHEIIVTKEGMTDAGIEIDGNYCHQTNSMTRVVMELV
jgi:hypothetical protein